MRIGMVTETYPPEVNGVARTVGLMAEELQPPGERIGRKSAPASALKKKRAFTRPASWTSVMTSS